jgi:hypothetical protein
MTFLSVTDGDTKYASLYTTIPDWKDVVNVPRMGSVKILVPVMDWGDMTMFYCHILEHEDINMMGMWYIMDPKPHANALSIIPNSYFEVTSDFPV